MPIFSPFDGWRYAISIHDRRHPNKAVGHHLYLIASTSITTRISTDRRVEGERFSLPAGGQIIAVGTPEQVAATKGSYTGEYLARLLPKPKAKAKKGAV